MVQEVIRPAVRGAIKAGEALKAREIKVKVKVKLGRDDKGRKPRRASRGR